jgi:hypothetical protein
MLRDSSAMHIALRINSVSHEERICEGPMYSKMPLIYLLRVLCLEETRGSFAIPRNFHNGTNFGRLLEENLGSGTYKFASKSPWIDQFFTLRVADNISSVKDRK